MPHKSDVVASLRELCQFGHGDFFTAEYRDRSDESVVGVRTPVFDGEICRDVLVQILEHRERVFLVAKERRRLQLCVGMAQKHYYGNRNNDKNRHKNETIFRGKDKAPKSLVLAREVCRDFIYTDFSHSGAERIW